MAIMTFHADCTLLDVTDKSSNMKQCRKVDNTLRNEIWLIERIKNTAWKQQRHKHFKNSSKKRALYTWFNNMEEHK